jgi:hypothetical protein
MLKHAYLGEIACGSRNVEMMSGAPVEQATLSILKASGLYYLVVVADQVTRSLSPKVGKCPRCGGTAGTPTCRQ